jgi:hypothetical protein
MPMTILPEDPPRQNDLLIGERRILEILRSLSTEDDPAKIDILSKQ